MARRMRKGSRAAKEPSNGPDTAAQGGFWHPLSIEDVEKVAKTAIRILTDIGLSETPSVLCDAVISNGGRFVDGRLLYSRDLIEATLKNTPRTVRLAGQIKAHDLMVGGQSVYAGTGGAAPNIYDQYIQDYRPSKLHDLYSAARLSDALDHVQFFSRSLVAGDIDDPLAFDLATATACLLGTSKHVMVQASQPAHVIQIAEICYEIAGSEAAFRDRPFLSLNINHAVPPLRAHDESFAVMAEAVHHGIPVHCNVFGQLGASSPVTMAGSVAQTLAETLAGLAFVHALDPKAPRIAGPRPMIIDLRTGGMAGGAGEQIMATALAVQVLRYWDLPCSVIAGATDSKRPDFQAGYEKALTINTAIQAGANLITQAVGTQAALMGVSFSAMVADNDMLGAIKRANIAPEISQDTLMFDEIKEVVTGEGHYLGRPETYARMRSDFLYPNIADRSPLDVWSTSEHSDIEERSNTIANTILETHWPNHLPEALRLKLTRQFSLPQQKDLQE